MNINQVIVLKETRPGEARVGLTPTAVSSLVKKGYRICVETGAGILAGFEDQKYVRAGAHIFTLDSTGFPSNSLFLRVKRPTKERELIENRLFSTGTVMMGFLDPFDVEHEGHMANWQMLGIIPIALELLPLTTNDPKNAQSAMSRFAGQLGLQDALQRYQGHLPKKVTVFGTGAAGLSAALSARDLQLPVQLFGRRKSYRKTIEEAGIIYHVLPETEQPGFIRSYLSDQTIIIAAARSVGKKSPLLIDEMSLAILPPDAVIIDLSAGEGGSVVGSKEDQVVIVERGIAIVNVSGYPKAAPRAASEAYAECIVHLLQEIIPAGKIDLQNTLLRHLTIQE